MKKFTKEYLIDILENQDYERFVCLHPHIQQHKELLIDEGNIYSVDGTKLNLEQIEFIHSIIQPWTYVLVYTKDNGKQQVFFNYHNGSNGCDGDAVKAMSETYEKLSSIKNNPLVEWTTLLGYKPDHCDDVYSWFMTFIFK